jgi:hypothetical protein
MKNTIKKLKIIDGIVFTRWEMCRTLWNIINTCTVIEGGWQDKFKREHPEIYPFDLADFDIWSTYDGCSALCFEIVNDELQCKIHIWNGDNMDGHMTTLRWMATLKVPMSFLENDDVKSSIDSMFTDHCRDEYRKYLKEQETKWIEQKEWELLK